MATPMTRRNLAPDPRRSNELVQVIAFPAHGNLERIMQVGNGVVAANQEAPPDHGTDLA